MLFFAFAQTLFTTLFRLIITICHFNSNLFFLNHFLLFSHRFSTCSDLLFAFFTMTITSGLKFQSVRRLHSPKNNLHIQLFLSFILRCVLFHIKRIFFYTVDENFNVDNNHEQVEMVIIRFLLSFSRFILFRLCLTLPAKD